MKIVNVGQNYRIIGGSDKYMLELQNLLMKYGHEVVPFAADDPENLPSTFGEFFPKSVDFNNPKTSDICKYIYSRNAATKFNELLTKVRPNLIHLHIYYGKLTAAILPVARKLGIPIVQTLHEYKLVCPVYTSTRGGQICEKCSVGKYWPAMLYKCNRGKLSRSILSGMEAYVSHSMGSATVIDKFIAVSQYQRDKLISRGVDRERISTIHNFIDTENLHPKYVPGKYFLYFGRIERIKGVFTLVDVMKKLGTSTKLKIIGEGNAKSELINYLLVNEIANVEVCAAMSGDDLIKEIRNCLCVIVPSEWPETFGLTIVESFACGKPVICSNSGGMPEVVSHGRDGLIFEAGNREELGKYVTYMNNNRAIAEDFGRRAREKAVVQFSASKHYERLMDIYRQVLKGGLNKDDN